MTLSPHLRDTIHEVADAAINPEGYSSDPAESDARSRRRDELEQALTAAVIAATADAGDAEPTDDQIYNRHGVEGGIAYDTADAPGSLGENDWRL